MNTRQVVRNPPTTFVEGPTTSKAAARAYGDLEAMTTGQETDSEDFNDDQYFEIDSIIKPSMRENVKGYRIKWVGYV